MESSAPIIFAVIGSVISLIIMYFVIKSAVRNGINESDIETWMNDSNTVNKENFKQLKMFLDNQQKMQHHEVQQPKPNAKECVPEQTNSTNGPWTCSCGQINSNDATSCINCRWLKSPGK